MLDYLYLFVACFLSVELFLKLKFISHINLIAKDTGKVFKIIISSNISDHWKERMVPVYALILLKSSLLVLGVLFLVILVFCFFIFLSSSLLGLLISVKGIILSFIISFAYIGLRAILLNE